MPQMKKRNGQLMNALGSMAPKERIEAANNVPDYDDVNIQGHKAYALPDELKLLSMLNTLKLESQFYRNEESTMKELRELIERVAVKDPYFAAQCVCWSRNLGEKMRSVSHLAAALMAPFASGEEWGKRFYGLFDKKSKSGGCIFRTDDMREIKDIYNTLTSGTPLSSAMKKGFASAIEKMDNYQLAKYRDVIIDISNIAHPDPSKSSAEVDIEIDGKTVHMKTIDAIMKGYTVSADTWEVANSEAGQLVAEAVKEGKLDEEEAKTVLSEAKNDNWEGLLEDGRLGMLAALRNIRNMMKNPRESVINKLCELVSDGKKIRNSGVMPYHIDIAYETIVNEFSGSQYASKVMNALLQGYEASVPNLAVALPGKTLVVVDCSGSMSTRMRNGQGYMTSSCIQKASLVAATIAKGANADVIRFGSNAEWYNGSRDKSVFDISRDLNHANMGGTYFGSAFELARRSKKAYDRIIVLSDNECNYGLTREHYKSYIHDVCDPYIYSIDLASYGTTQFKGEKVINYFGYGYALFDDIASREFNPSRVIDKVRSYVI